MKNIITLFVMFLLFISSSILAQLTVKDQEPSPNTLFQVNDEGTAGSVILPPLVGLPGDTDQKLYNVSGTLYWNGNQIGTTFNGAGWTYDGTNILTKSIGNKVGIGMTSLPQANLHVLGDFEIARFEALSSFGWIGLHNSSGKIGYWGMFSGLNDIDIGTSAINTEGKLHFTIQGYPKMSIIPNGNVGIGTVSPSKKLDVDKGNILVQGINSFQTGGDEGILFLGSVHHYIKGEFGFGIKLGTYAVGDVISIKEVSGNVGIGTTNPDAKLEVNGTVKVGSSGIKFSEIIELTGTTGLTGTNSIYVDYPAGYTAENSRVLSLEILDPYGGWVANGFYYNNGSVHCYLWGQIKIGYPDNSDFHSRPFRLVLMKI